MHTEMIMEKLEAIHEVDRLGNKRNPLSELFYVILSVQTSDVTYRSVYLDFYRAFYPWDKLVDAGTRRIAETIFNAGLSQQRALAIKAIVQRLVEDFGKATLAPLRRMSQNEAEKYLVSLPRIGIKTARCILGYSFDYDVLPLDTHCVRVLYRLGLLPDHRNGRNAHDIADGLFGKGKKMRAHILLVKHGRKICRAINPLCSECNLTFGCTYYNDPTATGNVDESS